MAWGGVYSSLAGHCLLLQSVITKPNHSWTGLVITAPTVIIISEQFGGDGQLWPFIAICRQLKWQLAGVVVKRLNGDFEKSSFARKIQPTNMIENVFNFLKREAFHEVQHYWLGKIISKGFCVRALVPPAPISPSFTQVLKFCYWQNKTSHQPKPAYPSISKF